MSYSEFWQWVDYRKRKGPLDPMLRNYERLSLIAFQIHRATGGKLELKDFMEYPKVEETVIPGSVQAIAAAFGATPTTKKFKRS